MSRLSRIFCVLAALSSVAVPNATTAQESKNAEPVLASKVRHVPTETDIPVEKECVGADGANVCWLKFTDGTRCVVANNADSGDTSTAINCHFSTPLERLHRMPKD